jgi:hypothetical protein
MTEGQSVFSLRGAPYGADDYILVSCNTVAVFSLWRGLSDETMLTAALAYSTCSPSVFKSRKMFSKTGVCLLFTILHVYVICTW